MTKTLFTLCINDYPAAITDRSFPLLKRYAAKIGADFHVIRERRWPDAPLTLEKLQVHALGAGNDWNLFVDADALVHPNLFDLTEHLPKSHVLHFASDFAPDRIQYDRYFQRDGRHIFSGDWLMAASDWCHDHWEPLTDLSWQEVVARITPLQCERAAGIPASHLAAEYVTARNIARYGLKYESYLDLLKRLGRDGQTYLWHQCLISPEQKVREMDIVLKAWKI